MTPEVTHADPFGEVVARFVAAEAWRAIDVRGEFRLGLSGGSSPKAVYEELAKAEVAWDKVRITFGDERAVPPDDPQSNYRMARLALLDRVRIPSGKIHRMRSELPPEEAADAYEAVLGELATAAGDDRYVHDLLLLGVGDDGHTASLFPETSALEETRRSVVANHVPRFGTYRITLTYPVINAARRVAFLVSGAGKEPVVQAILEGGTDYPAEGVRPVSGKVAWFLGWSG